MRTRVGYAGGSKERPTYRDLGDHTEAIQIDYDPRRIGYRDLLAVFWEAHDPTRASWSRQYASLLLFHGEEQERLARETAREVAERRGKKLATEILPAGPFWRAEDYHQKYRLRRADDLELALVEHLGGDRAMVDSTAAARLNGLLAGHGDAGTARAELRALGLPPTLADR